MLPFEWPQTLQALWAFMRSLLLTLMLYCLQFSVLLQFFVLHICYKHVCRLYVECCINKLLLLLLLELRIMEVVVTTGDRRRVKLQSNHHHQQTNTHIFTSQMPFLSPNRQCRSTEGVVCTTCNIS